MHGVGVRQVRPPPVRRVAWRVLAPVPRLVGLRERAQPVGGPEAGGVAEEVEEGRQVLRVGGQQVQQQREERDVPVWVACIYAAGREEEVQQRREERERERRTPGQSK